jgi:hypothetical protein
MRREGRPLRSVIAVAVCSILLIVAWHDSVRPPSDSQSGYADFQFFDSSLPTYLSQFCLNSTATSSAESNISNGSYHYRVYDYSYQAKNATSPALCAAPHFGDVVIGYNLSDGGVLQYEYLADFEFYNSSTDYLWFAPVSGTPFSSVEEYQITNHSGSFTVDYCPSGTCGTTPPGDSPSLPACSISTSFSSGWLGWGFWGNQCFWQNLRAYACNPIETFTFVNLILFLISVGLMAAYASVIGAFILGAGCAYIYAASLDPSGASFLGFTQTSCSWVWNWWNSGLVCITTTWTWTIWGGTPPAGF